MYFDNGQSDIRKGEPMNQPNEVPTEPKIPSALPLGPDGQIAVAAVKQALLNVAGIAASCFAEMRPDLHNAGERPLAGLCHDAQLACDRIAAYVISNP
jgi:hypothetical protein